jgi:hypothetical protein
MRIKPIIILISTLLIMLPGCGRRHNWRLHPYHAEQRGVELAVKPVTESESQERFGRRMIKRGYYPLQLHIDNKSDAYCILNPSQMGVALASPKKVAKRLHHKTMLITTALFMLGILGLEWFHPLSYASLVAFPVAAYLSARNRHITNSVIRDSIDKNEESIVIPPYCAITRHFFVPDHHFRPNFPVTLIYTKDNQALQFDVLLTSTLHMVHEPYRPAKDED